MTTAVRNSISVHSMMTHRSRRDIAETLLIRSLQWLPRQQILCFEICKKLSLVNLSTVSLTTVSVNAYTSFQLSSPFTLGLLLCPPVPSHFPKWRGTCPPVPNGSGATAYRSGDSDHSLPVLESDDSDELSR